MSATEEASGIHLRCTHCGETKPLEQFYRKRTNHVRYGRASQCRECELTRHRRDRALQAAKRPVRPKGAVACSRCYCPGIATQELTNGIYLRQIQLSTAAMRKLGSGESTPVCQDCYERATT